MVFHVDSLSSVRPETGRPRCHPHRIPPTRPEETRGLRPSWERCWGVQPFSRSAHREGPVQGREIWGGGALKEQRV